MRVEKALYSRKKRNGPELVVHGETDKPAKQEIVIQLLHSRRALRMVYRLQQQGAEQLLRGDGRASLPGIHGLKLSAQFGQGLIYHIRIGLERMVLGVLSLGR